MRAVFDSGVFVAAVVAPLGVSASALDLLAANRFQAIACPMLLEELDRVLRREKFRRWVSVEEADEYVKTLAIDCKLIDDPVNPPRVTADPKDDYLVALSLSAGVDVLVSGDPHLLKMDNPPLKILTPRAFLEILGQESA